jgi:L-2-hydroxyglutarate oxidase LhgO
MKPKTETEVKTTKTAKATEAGSTGQDLPEDGNIDKIRDILFGVQVRDFERKFSKLEERFGKELEGLREDTRQKLDKLEEFVSKEVNTLTDKIYEEQDLRSDAVKQVTSELQKNASDFEKKLTKFGEKTAKNETDIRTQILDQSKTLTDSIQKKQDEVMSTLEKEAQELRDDKADRTALADLFTEMAMRLTGDFKLPKSD